MRKIKLLGKVLLLLALLFLVLPYLIPSPANKYKTPSQAISANPRLFTGEIVDVEGESIYVEDLNSQSDNVITFIHGFGGSSFTWRDNKQFFVDKGYRVVTLDLPGFGLSSVGFDANYSHRAQATVVKNVLTKLGINKTVLVGHSMGANIALHFAQTNPEIIEKLVIVDGMIVESSSSNLFSGLINLDPLRRWGSLMLSWFYTQDTFSNTLKSAYFDPVKVTENTLLGYYLPLDIEGWQDALLGITRDGSNNAIPEPLSTINIPTLILWGGNDSWIPITQGKLLQEKISKSTFIEIPNSGHLPMEENSQKFNSSLWDFIK
jgi:pimeloyl-ACP methyl ester carboxylesterase